jgi:glycosyltransferase involved in cell wall biosynthesis
MSSDGQPKVTWLLPVKNAMPHLQYALVSIASQTYKHAEILARDDGSTDGTLDELHRWIPSRIPGRICSGPTLGVGRSLKFLVEQAETELCARMDGDDVSHPDRLRMQVEHMLAHPEVSALGTWINIIGADGIGTEEIWHYPTDDAEVRWVSRWMCQLNHPSVMFRRSRVLAAGNYANVNNEDGELWIRLSLTGEMYSLPKPLVLYRRHDLSKTGRVTDFYGEEAAAHESAYLFPGLSGQQALELWRLTHPHRIEDSGPVKIRHLLQLARAAKRFAKVCGKPDRYFQVTSTYKDQMYWLRRKLLRRWGLHRVTDLRFLLRSHQ